MLKTTQLWYTCDARAIQNKNNKLWKKQTTK